MSALDQRPVEARERQLRFMELTQNVEWATTAVIVYARGLIEEPRGKARGAALAHLRTKLAELDEARAALRKFHEEKP